MNSGRKFGGGRPPTGTPSLALSSTIQPMESVNSGSDNNQKS
ncbi:hypothetical protein SETIT_9G273000v2 [Setaria italica]|uniref:Uncharacterized protein n=1 Tax=Setaria italica TaxID=4555 RepID=A0A368SL59_SETIT|nr:hypothetical protein SETIT_9G273000v2 [Setaria italica]